MKTILSFIMLGMPFATCQPTDQYQENTTYLKRYFQEVSKGKLDDNQLIFIMQPGSCSACSTEATTLINEVFREHNGTKTFILNGNEKTEFLEAQFSLLPNSTVIIDSLRQIDRYGFLHVSDVIIEIKDQKIASIETIVEDNFRKIKRKYKK